MNGHPRNQRKDGMIGAPRNSLISWCRRRDLDRLRGLTPPDFESAIKKLARTAGQFLAESKNFSIDDCFPVLHASR